MWVDTPCSVTCGVGSRIRTRMCDTGDNDCVGDAIVSASCNEGDCPSGMYCTLYTLEI